mgnify:FL=1
MKLKKGLSIGTGYLSYRFQHLRSGLYCFNYHRVGNRETSPYDPNVFSCDAENFERQIKLIQENFEIVGLNDLQDILLDSPHLKKPYAIITFDDGYLDNYDVAYPILKSFDVKAVFFVPINYISQRLVPWWDEIAWMVRNTTLTTFKVDDDKELKLAENDVIGNIKRVLLAFKEIDYRSIEASLAYMRKASNCYMKPDDEPQLFMSWEQVREMSDNGMDIGSHTFSHRILAHIGDEQNNEILSSKAYLEEKLAKPVLAISYPVGTEGTFDDQTIRLTEQGGYAFGFSFIPGVDSAVQENRFSLSRFAISYNQSNLSIKLMAVHPPKYRR